MSNVQTVQMFVSREEVHELTSWLTSRNDLEYSFHFRMKGKDRYFTTVRRLD